MGFSMWIRLRHRSPCAGFGHDVSSCGQEGFGESCAWCLHVWKTLLIWQHYKVDWQGQRVTKQKLHKPTSKLIFQTQSLKLRFLMFFGCIFLLLACCLLSKAVCRSFRAEHRPVQGSGKRNLRLVRQAHTQALQKWLSRLQSMWQGFPARHSVPYGT